MVLNERNVALRLDMRGKHLGRCAQTRCEASPYFGPLTQSPRPLRTVCALALQHKLTAMMHKPPSGAGRMVRASANARGLLGPGPSKPRAGPSIVLPEIASFCVTLFSLLVGTQCEPSESAFARLMRWTSGLQTPRPKHMRSPTKKWPTPGDIWRDRLHGTTPSKSSSKP